MVAVAEAVLAPAGTLETWMAILSRFHHQPSSRAMSGWLRWMRLTICWRASATPAWAAAVSRAVRRGEIVRFLSVPGAFLAAGVGMVETVVPAAGAGGPFPVESGRGPEP